MTTWEDVVRLASELPEVEAATWYRTPALKVAGKGFARLRTEAEGGLVVLCGLLHDTALRRILLDHRRPRSREGRSAA